MLTAEAASTLLHRFNPTYPTHEQKIVEELRECDIPDTSSRAKSFQLIIDHFYSRLGWRLPPIVSDHERLSNIKKTNEIQLNSLFALRGRVDASDMDELQSSQRTLVPYFRTPDGANHGDVDPFEFGISLAVIERLIREGRTKIFNRVCCVSRHHGKFPNYLLDVFSHAIYFPHKGNWFLQRSSIAANTIHYTHGNPRDQVDRFSVPLLGTSMRRDAVRMKEISECFVPLLMDYDRNNQTALIRNKLRLNEVDYAGSITRVIAETVRGVKRLEAYMLRAAQKNEVFLTENELNEVLLEMHA